jgi:hypothetical protein
MFARSYLQKGLKKGLRRISEWIVKGLRMD